MHHTLQKKRSWVNYHDSFRSANFQFTMGNDNWNCIQLFKKAILLGFIFFTKGEVKTSVRKMFNNWESSSHYDHFTNMTTFSRSFIQQQNRWQLLTIFHSIKLVFWLAFTWPIDKWTHQNIDIDLHVFHPSFPRYRPVILFILSLDKVVRNMISSPDGVTYTYTSTFTVSMGCCKFWDIKRLPCNTVFCFNRKNALEKTTCYRIF